MVKQFLFRQRIPLLIFAAALFLRLIYFLEVLHTPVIEVLPIDARFYHAWALQIAHGDLLGGGRVFFMAPFYAYFLAAVYALTGAHYLHPLFLQLLIGAVSCVLLFFLGRRISGERTGLLAAALAAVYPPFILYDAALLKESLMIFTLLSFAVLYPVGGEGERDRRWRVRMVAAGGVLGVNALLRSNIFLLLPLLLAHEFLTIPRRIFLRRASLLLLGVAVTVIPVTVRNRAVGGAWVLTAAQGGMNLWTGNNPAANGTYAGAPFLTSEEPQYEDEDFRREASRREGRDLTLEESSVYWRDQAVRFVLSHPARFSWLLWRKFIAFTHATEIPSNLSLYFARDFSSVLRYDLFGFGLVFPFAVGGMYVALRRRKGLLPFLLIAVNFITSMIFFNASQYRVVAAPFFVFFAAFCGVVLYEHRADREVTARVLVIVLPLLLFVNYPDALLASISSRRVNYVNAATGYIGQKRFDRAGEMLRRCLAVDPAYALAHEKTAELLRLEGKPEEADRYLRNAIMSGRYGTNGRMANGEMEGVALFSQRRYPEAMQVFSRLLGEHPENEPALRNNIGLCYLRMKDIARAEQEFRRAVAKDPGYEKAYSNLALLYEKKGETATALNLYEKALSLQPGDEKLQAKILSLRRR